MDLDELMKRHPDNFPDVNLTGCGFCIGHHFSMECPLFTEPRFEHTLMLAGWTPSETQSLRKLYDSDHWVRVRTRREGIIGVERAREVTWWSPRITSLVPSARAAGQS